jgi:hypothetical protein
MELKISYAITCCNELEEITRLINFLNTNKREEDEICVLLDRPKASIGLLDQLYRFSSSNWIILKESTFKGNFADWKNELNQMCTKDYIVNIDSDELPNVELLNILPGILEANPEVDLYYVPRINTVSGITDEYLQKMGWNISKLDTMIEEKEFDLDNPKDRDEYELLKKYNLIIKESNEIKS